MGVWSAPFILLRSPCHHHCLWRMNNGHAPFRAFMKCNYANLSQYIYMPGCYVFEEIIINEI